MRLTGYFRQGVLTCQGKVACLLNFSTGGDIRTTGRIFTSLTYCFIKSYFGGRKTLGPI